MKKIMFALLGLSLFMGSAVAEPLQKVKMAHFGSARFLLYMPLYVAQHNGHFAKQGLQVDFVFAGNDNASFSMVLAGEAQFAVGDPVFTAISREKGGPGKVIAMMITSLGLSGVTRDPNIPEITNIQQLDGLRISSFPEPSTTWTLLSEIKRAHKLEKMKVVPITFGAQIAALEAGQVDIATDIEPSVSIAESKGMRRVFRLAPFTERQAVTGITTSDDLIEKQPELAQKLVRGLQAAINDMYEHPDVSYKVAAEIYPDVAPEVVKRAVDVMLAEQLYPKSIVVDDALWQRTLKTRLDSGELKAPQATDVAVDNRFAKAAQAP